MAELTRPKVNTRREEKQVEAMPAHEEKTKLKAELDDLLDDIDEVLEENAAEFVAEYIQKGGE